MRQSCAFLLIATTLSTSIVMQGHAAVGESQGISARSSLTTKPFPNNNVPHAYGSGMPVADDGARWYPTPEQIAKLPRPVRDREEKIVAVTMLPVALRRGPTLATTLLRPESETPAAFLPTVRQVEARAKPLLDHAEPTIVPITPRLPRPEEVPTNPPAISSSYNRHE